MRKKERIANIKALFLEHYKDAQTELQYTNLYELLIAVMLSAQCTDKRVNMVTPALFKAYPSTKELSKADLGSVAEIIKSVSFFNAKAKNLIAMAKKVEIEFNGEIPTNQKDLMSLSGVGQKSANVVLGEFLGMNYMAVDTHVFRVSHRLGLSKSKSAIDTEKDLTKAFKDNLNILHQAFVLFGRYQCKALKPMCGDCFVAMYCVSKANFKPQ
ncbi:MAG: endonuclease III [Helicobacter sp.]|uniref:endonuclease III n=1 Tax=Helicobacter sp. TaxID=218 RepID=UPI002A90D8DA|nr:endonuclease III [Helicobacter sp.]MDY5951155.1 endonuclease III [Helicobacter sp.]